MLYPFSCACGESGFTSSLTPHYPFCVKCDRTLYIYDPSKIKAGEFRIKSDLNQKAYYVGRTMQTNAGPIPCCQHSIPYNCRCKCH